MATLILFDTDVLIDYLRGHPDAQAELLAAPADGRAISAISVMELLVGAHSRHELTTIEAFVKRSFSAVLEVDEGVSLEARSLIASFALSRGLRIPDALIAATARRRGLRLVTGNLRHFSFVPDLDVDLPAYRKAAP